MRYRSAAVALVALVLCLPFLAGRQESTDDAAAAPVDAAVPVEPPATHAGPPVVYASYVVSPTPYSPYAAEPLPPGVPPGAYGSYPPYPVSPYPGAPQPYGPAHGYAPVDPYGTPVPGVAAPPHTPSAAPVYHVRVRAFNILMQKVIEYQEYSKKTDDATFEKELAETAKMPHVMKAQVAAIQALRGQYLLSGRFTFPAGSSQGVAEAFEAMLWCDTLSIMEDVSLAVPAGGRATVDTSHEIVSPSDETKQEIRRRIGMRVDAAVHPTAENHVRVEIHPRLNGLDNRGITINGVNGRAVRSIDLESTFEMSLGETMVLASSAYGNFDFRTVLIATVDRFDDSEPVKACASDAVPASAVVPAPAAKSDGQTSPPSMNPE